MDDQPNNGMRKTTKAAIGFSMFMLAIPQMKMLKEFIMGDQVVTNARLETTMKEGFARVEKTVADHISADVETHRRIRDLGREELVASEARCEKRSDKVEDRVSNLELVAFKLIGQRRPTN